VGVDRQLARRSRKCTYLYGRGVHQYFTNTLELLTLPPRISASIPTSNHPPGGNNLQYQSGGVYRQSQIIVSEGDLSAF